jgi:hypothetical protein
MAPRHPLMKLARAFRGKQDRARAGGMVGVFVAWLV